MKKLLIYIILALTLATAAAPTIAAAQTAQATQTTDEHRTIAQGFEAPIIPRPDTLPGPTVAEQKNTSIRDILVNRILPRFAVGFIGLIAGLALVFVIIGGVRFVTSYGNEESVDKAKKQVIYGLAGLMLAILSYTIVTIVINLQFVGDETQQQSELESLTEKAMNEAGKVEIEDSSVDPNLLPEPSNQAA